MASVRAETDEMAQNSTDIELTSFGGDDVCDGGVSDGAGHGVHGVGEGGGGQRSKEVEAGVNLSYFYQPT